MLKKYLIYLSLILSTALPVFCSNNSKKGVKKKEVDKLNLNPTYGDYQKPTSRFDSQFSCQFPGQLSQLLNYSLGEGSYAGGIFLTKEKESSQTVLIELLPNFFKQIKPVLLRTTLDLDNGDITETPFDPNITSLVVASQTIFDAYPSTLTETAMNEEAKRAKRVQVGSVEDLITVFNTTTVTATEGYGKNKVFKDKKNYHAMFLSCKTKSGCRMGYSRSNAYRGDDWQNMNRLCNKSSGIDKETTIEVYLTQCLWYQLQYVLKKDNEYKKHFSSKLDRLTTSNGSATLLTILARVGAASLATYVAFKFKSNIPQTASLLFEKFLKPVDIFAQSCGTIVTNKLSERIADFTNKRLITKK